MNGFKLTDGWYIARYGNTKVALDPCPFCGGKAEYTAISCGETDDIACGCLRCRAHGPYKPTIDKAARAWNRRKPVRPAQCTKENGNG